MEDVHDVLRVDCYASNLTQVYVIFGLKLWPIINRFYHWKIEVITNVL